MAIIVNAAVRLLMAIVIMQAPSAKRRQNAAPAPRYDAQTASRNVDVVRDLLAIEQRSKAAHHVA